jgi:hypothetical protein
MQHDDNTIVMTRSRRTRPRRDSARVRDESEVLVGSSKGKRPLRRSRRRWEDNIKIDLREVGWNAADWINLVQDRNPQRILLNSITNLRVAWNTVNMRPIFTKKFREVLSYEM